MAQALEELDYRETPMGPLVLRRRCIPLLDNVEVYEVKLGEEFLMSSLFYEAEIALAALGLAETSGAELDVVVGGLGLGYTAEAALDHPGVRSLRVIDALPAVIEWHEKGLVPLGQKLSDDPRCQFVLGDFFAMAGSEGEGFDPDQPGRQFHAILLDVDHSPSHHLHARHAVFYESDGLRRLATYIQPGGVFALWSNDPPEAPFMKALESVFTDCRAEVIQFENPVQGGTSTNTIYLGRKVQVD